MGIGSKFRKFARKFDDYTIQLSKDFAQDALDFATGKDQENKKNSINK